MTEQERVEQYMENDVGLCGDWALCQYTGDAIWEGFFKVLVLRVGMPHYLYHGKYLGKELVGRYVWVQFFNPITGNDENSFVLIDLRRICFVENETLVLRRND